MPRTEELHVNLAVIGAGIAGMCAAVTAARHNMTVLLVNDRSVLGGNASSEVGVEISGACHHGLNPAVYAKETGVVDELRQLRFFRNRDGGYRKAALDDAAFFDFIYREKNITLMLNTLFCSAETAGGRVSAVTLRHLVNETVWRVSADYFVDATGNGALAASAGAAWRQGREAQSEYGERWAPEAADAYTMGNTFMLETEDMGHPVSFHAPDFAYDVSEMEFIRNIDKPENFRGLSIRGSHWTYEFGGQMDIIRQSEDVDLELRRLTYGIWDYIKNSGRYPKAANFALKRIYAKSGSRESRRIIGDYVLNENDIEQKIDFPDSVAIGGWPMDVHAPLGILDPAPASHFIPVTGVYNIPLRSLYARGLSNLFLAGRDISATHIALGSTRVMATCGAIGQAVATAALVGLREGRLPAPVIASEHIGQVQRILLEDDQTILHRSLPPLGGFAASATCEAPYENVAYEDAMPLERDYALALPVPGGHTESVEIWLRAAADTVLRYRLLTGDHPETYLPAHAVAELTQAVAAGQDGFVRLPIPADVGGDGKLYLVLCENPALSVGISTERPLGAVTLRMHTAGNHALCNHDSVPLSHETGYTHMDHQYEKERNILFRGLLPVQHPYAASEVLDGAARPYGGRPGLWVASGELPQTLTLTAETPADIPRLSLTFDSMLELDQLEMRRLPMPRRLVRRYTLTVDAADGTHRLTVTDNYRRCVIHELNFRGVTRIALTLEESWGGAPGVFAVRIFDSPTNL